MRGLVLAASLALALAIVTGYIRYAAVDSDQFANRASAALHNPSVRALIANQIDDQIVADNPAGLSVVRPLIQSVTSSVVDSSAFSTVFRASIRGLHAALLDRSATRLTLTVANVGSLVSAQLPQLGPLLARLLPSTRHVTIISRRIGSLGTALINGAHTIKLLAPIFSLLFVTFAAGAIAVSKRRARTLVSLSAGITVVGLLLAVGVDVSRSLAVHQVVGSQQQAAAGAVWDAFFGALGAAGWILAGVGAAVTAVAAYLVRRSVASAEY